MEKILLIHLKNNFIENPQDHLLMDELTQIDIAYKHLLEDLDDTEMIYLYIFIVTDKHKGDKKLQGWAKHIKSKLLEYGIKSSHIEIEWMTIFGDKYNQLLNYYDDFYSMLLHKWGYQHLYILTSTGTSLGKSILFMEGVKHFGKHIHPVWREGNSDERNNLYIQELNNMIPRISFKSIFTKWLKSHDYHAVLHTLSIDEINVVIEERENIDSFIFALKSLIARLNFNFKDSLKYWENARHLFADELYIWEQTKKTLELLNKENETKDQYLAKLAELYRHLSIYLEIGDIPAFLTRFYRFREAVLLFIRYYGQTREAKEAIYKRGNIHRLINEISDLYDDWEIDGYYGAYFYSKSKNVTDTLLLRNQSFVGHGRKGFSIKNIWTEYSGYIGLSAAEGYKSFEHDTTLMLRDLGIKVTHDIRLIRNILILKLDWI